jgi:hypothetical protein
MYLCIEEGHKLEWFKQITKRESLEGAWFYCKRCHAQSPWISWQNLPADIDWHDLHEMKRPLPSKIPFVSKGNEEPTDLALFKQGLLNCPKPDSKTKPTPKPFYVKAGIYVCIDETHNLRFHYWNWMSGFTRVWFICKDCKLNSGWIYIQETKGFDRTAMTRKNIKPGKNGFATRTGGLPVTPVTETTPIVEIQLH